MQVPHFFLQEPLIHLSYKEFNWEYAEPSGGEQDSTSQTPQASNDTEGAMPCLFIYLKLIKGDVASPQLLQVFSKQVNIIWCSSNIYNILMEILYMYKQLSAYFYRSLF